MLKVQFLKPATDITKVLIGEKKFGDISREELFKYIEKEKTKLENSLNTEISFLIFKKNDDGKYYIPLDFDTGEYII